MSPEHIFPQWLGGVIPGEGRIRHQWLAPDGSESEDRDWTADHLTMTAKIVCNPCNTGWMHGLEESARPFLESMIRGHGRHLYAEGSRQVAYWALKTTLTSDRAQEAEHWSVPDEDFAALYDAQDVLPGTFVWLGRSRFVSGGLARHRTLVGPCDTGPPSGLKRRAYAATLALGHLVIEVMRVDVGEGETLQVRGDGPVVVHLWPEGSVPVTWPPPFRLSRRETRDLGEFLAPRPIPI